MNHDYFDEAMSYENLRLALRRVCRNVRWKDSVVGYEKNAARNTWLLRKEILSGTYKISAYQHFVVHEPKTREITATRIRDRQVQMALCTGGLYEDITEHFIYDNCACQIGKGTLFALKRLKHHLVRYCAEHGPNGWVLKVDVKQFFPSTPHGTAKKAIEKRVSDKRAQQMVFDVIDSFGGDHGIGLGSQISQLVELAVLDDIDHYIKEKLMVKHYVRYMDDLILIHPSKEYLRHCKDEIERMLNDIGLSINEKTVIYPLKQGVKFLKWRFVVTKSGRILVKMDKRKPSKQRRKLKRLIEKEISGELPGGTSEQSLKSWLSNAKNGDTFFQRKSMIEFYYREKRCIMANIEQRLLKLEQDAFLARQAAEENAASIFYNEMMGNLESPVDEDDEEEGDE